MLAAQRTRFEEPLDALHALRDERAGHCMLQTIRTEWNPETAVRTYRKLTETGRTFRSLESGLGLRPVWNRETERQTRAI